MVVWYNIAISNNHGFMKGVLQLTKSIIEILNMFVKVLVTERERGIKDYSTRKIIDYS